MPSSNRSSLSSKTKRRRMRACPPPAAGMCWYSRNADRVLRTKQRGHGLLKHIFGGSPRACFSEMVAQRRKFRGHGRDVGMTGERRAASERGEVCRFVFRPCDLSSFRFFVRLSDYVRPCPTVFVGRARAGFVFFQGTEFLFFLFLLSAPADRSKALSGGTGTFLRKSAYSRYKIRRARGRFCAGACFPPRRRKLKNFTFFSEYYEKFTFFTI